MRAFDNAPGSLAERLRELVAAEVAAHSEVVGGAAGSCELTWSTCYSRHSIYAELITDRRTTAGRGGLRARQQMAVVQTQETSNIHRKWYLAGPLTRLHDAVCRRWLRRSPAVSWSEVATLCAHARRPKRSWATNVSRSRSVHSPASSQMVTGRTKRPASYRAGHARGRRTAARREDDVGRAARVAWAAA